MLYDLVSSPLFIMEARPQRAASSITKGNMDNNDEKPHQSLRTRAIAGCGSSLGEYVELDDEISYGYLDPAYSDLYTISNSDINIETSHPSLPTRAVAGSGIAE